MPKVTLDRHENPVLFDAIASGVDLPTEVLELVRLAVMEQLVRREVTEDDNLFEVLTRIRQRLKDAGATVRSEVTRRHQADFSG